MKEVLLLTAALFIFYSTVVQGQCTAHFTISPETFDDVPFNTSGASPLPPNADNSGWTVFRNDSVVVNSNGADHFSLYNTSSFGIADYVLGVGRAATSFSGNTEGDVVDSWLISPSIPLSQDCKQCSVNWEAIASGTAAYEVFAGRSNNAATLLQDSPILEISAESGNWTSRSASILIPSTGTFYVAWRHISSGADADLLQIDDVSITCGSCLSDASWNISSGECTCKTQATYDDVDGCTCEGGIDYQSVAGCWCSQGRVYAPGTGCECSGSATFDGGRCTCPAGMTYVQGVGCECKSSAGSGTCGCTGDAIYSDSLGCTCTGNARYYPLIGCYCGSGDYVNSQGCTCNSGGEFDEKAFGCVCQGDRSYLGIQGCTCLSGATYNAADSSCHCAGDGIYVKDSGCSCSQYGVTYDEELGCVGSESSVASALSSWLW